MLFHPEVPHGRYSAKATSGRLQGPGCLGGRPQQTKTIAEFAKAYQVHPVQISQWKKQLLDGTESLFRDGRRRDHDDGQVLQAELYERIGRLNMEIEWLKKSVARSG